MIKGITLYDKVINKKRYLITKDRYNWILLIGNPKISDEDFRTRARRTYYQSFEQFMFSFIRYNFRDILTKIDEKSIKRALIKAEGSARTIGRKLDLVNWNCISRGDYCPNCDAERMTTDD